MKKKKLIRLETRGSRIRAHRKMWRWLAENPKMNKWQWPKWKSNGGKYPDQPLDCFLCGGVCGECPLVWPGGLCTRHKGSVGLFSLWVRTSLEETRAHLAKQIAELPVRKERKND